MNRIVTDDGVAVAYRVDGRADLPPVLFINSLGTDLRMWEPQVAALSPRFCIIRSDMRGHGRSEVPPGPYTVERLGRDVLALLDALALERVQVCGLSLGGLVALWLAACHPERLHSAIFANTAARIGTQDGWNTRIAAVQAGGMAAVRETVLARFFSPGFRRAQPETVAAVGAMLTATQPSGYIAACAAVRDADLHPLLTQILLPALIIAGGQDEATPPVQSEELHRAIPASQLAVLPQAAHLTNLEQPAVFVATLQQFWANQEGLTDKRADRAKE